MRNSKEKLPTKPNKATDFRDIIIKRIIEATKPQGTVLYKKKTDHENRKLDIELLKFYKL